MLLLSFMFLLFLFTNAYIPCESGGGSRYFVLVQSGYELRRRRNIDDDCIVKFPSSLSVIIKCLLEKNY